MSDDLFNRYVALFGSEPTSADEITRIEEILGVLLPRDFKEVSSFYSGGILGGISHHAISNGGPPSNIVDETQRLRAAIGLPRCFVVLAEPPASLIVLNTNVSDSAPAVIWCDAFDVCHLGNPNELHSPHIWPSYASFFGFLLDIEEEERNQLLSSDA